MSTSCDQITDDLADLVANDPTAVARHADHLSTCDTCRDARHDATSLAKRLSTAGDDHVAPSSDSLVASLLAKLDAVAAPAPEAPAASPAPAPVKTKPAEVTPIAAAKKPKAAPSSRSPWLAGALAAVAVGGVGLYKMHASSTTSAPDGVPPVAVAVDRSIGHLDTIERGAADKVAGIELKTASGWTPLAKAAAIPAGAELRTDERTRAAFTLADGTHLVLDHRTTIAFATDEARHITLTSGRIVADVAHVDGRPASIKTPGGTIDVVGTKFAATATDTLTSVQVVRGTVILETATNEKHDVRAGEEGTIDHGTLTVAAAPALSRDVAWAELGATLTGQPDEVTSGLGALRAYKPGESRDKDWNLALAKHDVKIRIVGPIARTEITETFRNDATTQLEGVYQFPLPADAQIDSLALDNKDATGGFLDGAFVDKERGAKIWKGVIDKATPHPAQIATNEMIWVPGKWRDPALLDWKRGGRFELRIFPIPAKGSRTIKIAYTQVVTPRGPWRQYVYPLPHSVDGSTVADQFSVDVEVRGAEHGQVRAVGYPMTPDPARKDVDAITLAQGGFVPRGDLVVDYRAADGDAEVRAWSFAGGAAVAPDDKIAKTKNVGIDPKVIDAQKAVAADLRPTAVVALHPKLPRWSEDRARDYVVVIDGSQSMVGERFTRASDLAKNLVNQMDRRDRYTVLVCDSECRRAGDLRSPSAAAAGDLGTFLTKEAPAGASDVVGAIRAGAEELRASSNEKWVLFVGDGFATTGFRRVADVERAIAASTSSASIHVSTIGIGSDADDSLLAAAARGGGGSYLAWHPGERVNAVAIAALESTFGAVLRDATVELPAGLVDSAPSVLPTIRTGDEVLVAARMTGDVKGDVVVRGTVGGQPFEERVPLALAVSAAAGNGFVPRLWASLAIDQLEHSGAGGDRTKIVALSQGYGVMSRETSLLVLESQAMFDAFGVDRGQPTQKFTGEEALDESTGNSAVAAAANTVGDAPVANNGKGASSGYSDAPATGTTKATESMDKAKAEKTPMPDAKPTPAPVTVTAPRPPRTPSPKVEPAKKAPPSMHRGRAISPDDMTDALGTGHEGMILVHREWIRIPSVASYDGVNSAITKAIADAEAALAANPDSRERHRNLVQALSYAGDIDHAREIAARWLERDKLDGQALGYLADLLGRDGQRDLALRTLAGLVDLDPDRVALHERMVRTYESAGRLQQACGHRIALAALQPKVLAASAQALRCLRGLGRADDADLVSRALPDDATRAQAEKLATAQPLAVRATGELVVNGHWDSGADLDITLVTPDGTRVSWMGGRPDVIVTDAVSAEREQLALKSIKRGNYLVEIGRGKTSASAPRGTVRGTLDINLLGAQRSLPFELSGSRAVVARLSIGLQEVMYDDNGTPVYRNYGEPGWQPPTMQPHPIPPGRRPIRD